eukprot:1161996-Pelagomonas_calceolata.AAC.1
MKPHECLMIEDSCCRIPGLQAVAGTTGPGTSGLTVPMHHTQCTLPRYSHVMQIVSVLFYPPSTWRLGRHSRRAFVLDARLQAKGDNTVFKGVSNAQMPKTRAQQTCSLTPTN